MIAHPPPANDESVFVVDTRLRQIPQKRIAFGFIIRNRLLVDHCGGWVVIPDSTVTQATSLTAPTPTGRRRTVPKGSPPQTSPMFRTLGGLYRTVQTQLHSIEKGYSEFLFSSF